MGLARRELLRDNRFQDLVEDRQIGFIYLLISYSPVRIVADRQR